MKNIKKILSAAGALFLSALLLLASSVIFIKDVQAETLSAGTYEIDGELSAYLAAMGGVEFGGPLLTGISLVIDEEGNEYLELTLGKSSVTIYSITCDTFVDASPSTITTTRGVEDGVIGIYDTGGNLVTEGVSYTLSEDTALNSADEEVNYVDSITYPISSREDTYDLAMYINSNVMGVEFCNENDDATETTYQAILTVDWSNVDALGSGTGETSEETTEEETGEETEEAAVEADEELEGLAIYSVDDDEEEIAEDEDDEEEIVEDDDTEGGISTAVIVVIVVICVVVIAAVIIIIAAVNSKKKKAAQGGSDKQE